MEWLRAFDENAFRALHAEWHRAWLDPVFWFLSTTGLGYVQALAILVAAGVVGGAQGVGHALRRNMGEWGWPLLLSFALSGAINTLFLKQIVGRERPSNYVWAQPQESAYYDGFPSGHTSTSFGIALMAVFLTRGTRHAWVGWAALSWAALVGISRVYRGVHWPTDVIGGALVGVVGACIAGLYFNKVTRKSNGNTRKGLET